MFLALLLGVEDPAGPVAAALAEYRAKTRAGPSCAGPQASDDIMVCAARHAEKWRVPFIQYDAGDPRHEGVPAERARYLRTRTPCEEHGPFLTGCGSVGVSMTMGFGGANAGPLKLRPGPP